MYQGNRTDCNRQEANGVPGILSSYTESNLNRSNDDSYNTCAFFLQGDWKVTNGAAAGRSPRKGTSRFKMQNRGNKAKESLKTKECSG